MKRLSMIFTLFALIGMVLGVGQATALIDPTDYHDECSGADCGAPPTGGLGGGGGGGAVVLVTYNLGPLMYISDDQDDDGIMDYDDNCEGVANDQTDSDGDGVGDACDSCPYVSNPGLEQYAHMDTDGIGDACDDDVDGDGAEFNEEYNYTDNCPLMINPNQLDTDGDGMGNLCDNDDDGDGIPDIDDDCPTVPSSEETASCLDSDGDGFANGVDYCPFCKSDQNTDNGDGDGIGDACDNCPKTPNPDQLDSNKNGIGDACEA